MQPTPNNQAVILNLTDSVTVLNLVEQPDTVIEFNGHVINTGEVVQNGTTCYLNLSDKPMVNQVELIGNRILPDTRLTNNDLENLIPV
jgi:hypothetical protein